MTPTAIASQLKLFHQETTQAFAAAQSDDLPATTALLPDIRRSVPLPAGEVR